MVTNLPSNDWDSIQKRLNIRLNTPFQDSALYVVERQRKLDITFSSDQNSSNNLYAGASQYTYRSFSFPQATLG
ncbi:hypothetical protein Tco_1303963 [Tanacetum coccineum]